MTYNIYYTLRRLYDGDGSIHRIEDVDFDDLVGLSLATAQAETAPARLTEVAELWVGQLDDPPAGTYFVEARVECHQDGLSWTIISDLESECVEVSSQ